ncbi:thioredoxin fold domain-containing protein [Geomesophilobacter sediminis]|uniref:Thioredoxin fold domain-containing protein n=1 Tax=Geomesophilobacter sediminis TaxID=2798584 RepID=A0A8J7M3A6_9BACT|nr:thioredoxin fold domain-containing protein [Geomesophilobacter sediminis]MBJ6727940.1 thioredoxin fold domain-containing protein [Geomesophilobacter sediminis]
MKTNRVVTRLRAVLLFSLVAVLFGAVAHAAQDDLDLNKAVKVGTGKTMVIEFTDPDCPYCRKAEAFFRGRPDVTRYIFFLPLKNHPNSKPKVQYVLSARDKAKAYLELPIGPLDAHRMAEITPEGIKLQEEHHKIAKENKMNSTPSFLIYGRIIEGFDLRKLTEALGK